MHLLHDNKMFKFLPMSRPRNAHDIYINREPALKH